MRYQRVLLPILLLVAWEIAAFAVNNPFIIPSLTTVVPILLHPFSASYTLGTGSLAWNASSSITRVGLGFLIAYRHRNPAGYPDGEFPALNDAFDSLIELLRPIPPLAWVPWLSRGSR